MNGLISLTIARYPPREFLGRAGRDGTRVGRLAGAAFAVIWLPAGFCLATAAAGGLPWQAGPDAWLHLALLVPAGLPLALAFGALRRRGRGVVAWLALMVLAPLTAAGCVEAAAFGPVAVAVCAAASSLPAWLACPFLGRRVGRRSCVRPAG